jgi:ribosomal-protein-serine acetyltransferase
MNCPCSNTFYEISLKIKPVKTGRQQISSDLALFDPASGFGIRPYRITDIPFLYNAACESIEQVYPWLPWCHPGYTLDEARSWVYYAIDAWASAREYEFVIFHETQKAFAGGLGLNQINMVYRMSNLGYWVRSSKTGKGAASAATRLAAKFGFRRLGLKRIEIVVAVENMASQRVAEKAGAKREGILRNRVFMHERSYDAAMFSLIPTDFESQE